MCYTKYDGGGIMPYAILSIILAPVLLFALIAYDHGREENLHNDEKENNPDGNKEENRAKSDKSSSKNK